MFQKFLTTFLMAIMFAVTIPAFAGTASAQRRDNDRNRRYSRDNNRYNNDRNYDNRTYDNTNYNDQYYEDDYYYDQYGNKKPNVYDRHRKAINLGVATGAGAVIGAIFGGKKGALIGAAAGVATGAIITAKQKPRNPNSYPYQY
ncbi:MAG TPA: hypothetical protein PLP21_11495 [Pyrinomonadaceae bacterium]|nr:hypothetical protein [Acidobacteriota bacterium]HQZ96934.1 hypothetical protein [Pyrinomonadaceae bacterium]